MQPEDAVHCPNLRRLDQLGMGDRHGMQHAFERCLPKLKKSLQFGEVGTNVIGLPDVGLQQPGVIGASIQDVGRRQAVAGHLLAEILSYHLLSPFLDSSDCVFRPSALQAKELSKLVKSMC